MKPFTASLDVVIMRYYLMMAVVIIPFFIGIPALSIIALPIFFLAFMGISFKSENADNKLSVSSNVTRTKKTKDLKRAA